MKKKTRLLKNLREEFNTQYRRLESSQEGKFTYYLMGLIIDHIEHNYNDEEDKFVKEIMKYRGRGRPQEGRCSYRHKHPYP